MPMTMRRFILTTVGDCTTVKWDDGVFAGRVYSSGAEQSHADLPRDVFALALKMARGGR